VAWLTVIGASMADVATQSAPGGTDLFSYNQFQLRGEIHVGIGVLRPQAFCDVSQPG
jgi:hypothetical protein